MTAMDVKDPTTTNLGYALLDQKVAAAFAEQSYAYVPVRGEEKQWTIGIAVEDQRGYSPLFGPDLQWDDYDEASDFCIGMNLHLGLKDEDATRIIASTLR